MGFKSLYLYFINYFFNIFSLLSEYYCNGFIENKSKIDIGMVDCQSIDDTTKKQKIFESIKTHKEICDIYVLECMQNETSFLSFDDFVEKLMLYSKCHGIKNITKLNVKYLQGKFSSLEHNLSKKLEDIYL